MIHLIKKIVAVNPYQITLFFNTGENLTIDLEESLQEWALPVQSRYRQLLDPEYFKTVKLDPDAETISWDNGIDLCPDVLYEMSKRTTDQTVAEN